MPDQKIEEASAPPQAESLDWKSALNMLGMVFEFAILLLTLAYSSRQQTGRLITLLALIAFWAVSKWLDDRRAATKEISKSDDTTKPD